MAKGDGEGRCRCGGSPAGFGPSRSNGPSAWTAASAASAVIVRPRVVLSGVEVDRDAVSSTAQSAKNCNTYARGWFEGWRYGGMWGDVGRCGEMWGDRRMERQSCVERR